MDIPVEPPRRPTARRRRMVKWIAGAVVVLAVLAGLGIWWFFRDDAPAQVELDAATAAIDEDTVPSARDADRRDRRTGHDRCRGRPVTTDGGHDGGCDHHRHRRDMDRRHVDREFSFEDSTGTFVGFRVQEELTGIGSTTAVGRTPEVSGTMTIDGTTVTAVSVEANMDAITTNDSRRDDNARARARHRRVPGGDVRAHTADRARRGGRQRRAGGGHGDRRSHDPRHDAPGRDPARGATRRRCRGRRRIGRHRVRRLRRQRPRRADRRVGRGPRGHRAPAVLHR